MRTNEQDRTPDAGNETIFYYYFRRCQTNGNQEEVDGFLKTQVKIRTRRKLGLSAKVTDNQSCIRHESLLKNSDAMVAKNRKTFKALEQINLLLADSE